MTSIASFRKLVGQLEINEWYFFFSSLMMSKWNQWMRFFFILNDVKMDGNPIFLTGGWPVSITIKILDSYRYDIKDKKNKTLIFYPHSSRCKNRVIFVQFYPRDLFVKKILHQFVGFNWMIIPSSSLISAHWIADDCERCDYEATRQPFYEVQK